MLNDEMIVSDWHMTRLGIRMPSRTGRLSTACTASARPLSFDYDYWCDGGREARFFPSWPELKEICDRRMDGRLRLRRALVWAHDQAPA